MKKEIKSIIDALSIIFFDDGFDRDSGKHGLGYWSAEDNELLDKHCNKIRILNDYLLNTVNMNGKWFLRVYQLYYDFDGNQASNAEILLYIPVDPDLLCSGEMSKSAELIQTVCFPDLDEN